MFVLGGKKPSRCHEASGGRFYAPIVVPPLWEANFDDKLTPRKVDQMDQRSETGVIDKHRPGISILVYLDQLCESRNRPSRTGASNAAELPQPTQLLRPVVSLCCRCGRISYEMMNCSPYHSSQHPWFCLTTLGFVFPDSEQVVFLCRQLDLCSTACLR